MARMSIGGSPYFRSSCFTAHRSASAPVDANAVLCRLLHARYNCAGSALLFEKLFRKKTAPLRGAPAVRRQKTYSAQSGYVYQYHYEGHRRFGKDNEEGTEFVFDVSADRKTSAPVSVFVTEDAVHTWEEKHGRLLAATERYATAKMALFQAFDERAHPGLMKQDIRVRAADLEAILEGLGID